MKTEKRNIITLSLTGIAAYMLADFFHEVVGHTLASLLIGQHIDLISSAFFRSSPGSYISGFSGPLANLIFGLLFLIYLNRAKNLSPAYRFLLLIIMAYNFFWLSGTILHSSYSKRGDWIFLFIHFNLENFGKPFLILAGIAAYYFSIRLINKHLRLFASRFSQFPITRAILYSYIGAVVAAIIAGLFFTPDRIGAAKEGLLEMIASLPLLFLKPGNGKTEGQLVKVNLFFNTTVIILFIIFCLTLGAGIFPG